MSIHQVLQRINPATSSSWASQLPIVSNSNLSHRSQTNIAAYYDLPVAITDTNRKWKPWSEIWLRFLETLQVLSTKSLFENLQLGQVRVISSQIRQFDISIMSSQADPFSCPMFKTFAQKKRRKSRSTCHNLSFKKLVRQYHVFSVYAIWLSKIKKSIRSKKNSKKASTCYIFSRQKNDILFLLFNNYPFCRPMFKKFAQWRTPKWTSKWLRLEPGSVKICKFETS